MIELFELKNKLYGINISQLKKGLSFLGFSYNAIKNNKIILSSFDLNNLLLFFINHYIINVELKDRIIVDIRNMKRLRTYKGIRHNFKLPAHGQHTRANARTLKKIKNGSKGKKYKKKK
jgi:ribosomal protein S13